MKTKLGIVRDYIAVRKMGLEYDRLPKDQKDKVNKIIYIAINGDLDE